MELPRAVGIIVALDLIFGSVALASGPSSFKYEDITNPIRDDLVKRYGRKDRYTAEEILSLEQPKPAMFKAADVKTHFEIIGKLNPAKTHLFDQLVKKFGKKASYSADEIRAIESPEVPSKEEALLRLIAQAPKSRIDAFSKEEVRKHFALLRSSDPKTKASMEALEKKYPGQDFYSAAQVRDVEKNGEEWITTRIRPDTPVTFIAEREGAAKHSVLIDGWKTPLVRHDWTDVLVTDDTSVGDLAKKKTDDLVGATVSYSYDAKADTDTWTTVGALIWPWVYNAPVKETIFPQRVIIAPSVSVNRISTNGSPSVEVDQVLYRIGMFGEWYKPLGLMTLLQLRASPVFGTNTGHDARMPGYELDLEPSWLFNNGVDGECIYKIGFKNILWFKAPLLEDSSDQSILDYQVRIWMHLEGGDIQDTGKSFAATPGDFFRVGPVAQLRINSFFPVPILSKGLSFTAQYSYLPTIHGLKGHDYLLNLTAALTILADKAYHEKLSLTGSYTNGGLNFTKQNVDTFTLGLSVLF
jgi:hypothetical protein